MHRIGYLLSDGFQVMALASQSVFEYANIAAGEAFYSIENFSVAGGEVRSSFGMSVGTRPLGGRAAIDDPAHVGVGDRLHAAVQVLGQHVDHDQLDPLGPHDRLDHAQIPFKDHKDSIAV